MARRRAFDIRNSVRLRTLFVGISIAALLLVFVVRLTDIQVVRAAELNEQSDERRTQTTTLYGARGDIIDFNGETMATSVARWDVTISPQYTRDVELEDGTVVSVGQVLRSLAEITGQDPNAMATAIQNELERNPESDYLVLSSGLTVDQFEQVRLLRSDWNLPYMILQSRPERTYPLGSVGGNILGFEGSDGEPLAGMELIEDACLAPEDGSRLFEQAADGTEIPGTVRVNELPQDGGTLELTVDSGLQYSMQQVLAQYTEDFNARGATAIVLRADGTIAAVAETPSVDPNHPIGVDPDYRGSRSFTEAYEPGSTFKTLTMAAMIDQGIATPTDEFVVPFEYRRGDVSLHDSFRHPEMRWTSTGILVHSSNVGMVMMADDLDREVLYNYLDLFGFGQVTNIEFLGEQAVPLNDPGSLDLQTRANQIFGQGIAVTPIQMASSFLPFANDGMRPALRLVESCTTADGEVIVPEAPDPVHVIEPETADSLLAMMERVATGGSRDTAVIEGYNIALKTGTAEVARADGSGYDADQWIISATGVLSSDNPEYVIHVMIDRPTPEMRTTGASPLFHDIVNLLIRHYSIPPSSEEPSDLPVEW